MGNCVSGDLTEEEKTQLAKSKEIEKIIKKDKIEKNFKIIILGTGDSGKSTFIRQIYSTHGPDKDLSKEKKKFLEAIKINCLESFKQLLNTIKSQKIEIGDKLIPCIESVLSADALTVEIAKDITKLWKNKKIKSAYTEVNHLLQIGSNEPYFWEKSKDIALEDYNPTKDDIIRAKLRTLGILDFEFEIENCKFNLVDVGGQRSERRKWIHCFDKVSSVIYLSAIDEYDGKKLFEDNDASRFFESITLFEKLSSSTYFEKVPFILFLNKIDLFKEKIKFYPLSDAFPDYIKYVKSNSEVLQGKDDFDIGVMYLRELYHSRFRGQKGLYIFETNALDTEKCIHIFDSIRDQVLVSNFDQAGL